MKNTTPLATLLQHRGAFTLLLASAALLALGVSLFAAAISNALADYSWALWLLSVIVLLASVGFIARQAIPSRHIRQELRGFVLIHEHTNDLLPVPRYEFSEEIASCMKGLFAENEAPKKLFVDDPVRNTFERDPKTGITTVRKTEAGKLIVEATEYYVLETLSTHLTDYFNKPEFDSTNLKEIRREDVSGILFTNRFLDTFSRPMHERAAFIQSPSNKRDHGAGEIVASYGLNGVRYSRFDLNLPLGATVQREGTSIAIETPKFKLVFDIDFSGMSTVLPRGFSKFYLDDNPDSKAKPYEIKLSTDVTFKPLSLLSHSGWEYHAWIDSFLHQLESEFSSSSFFETIQWESALTVSLAVERRLARANRTDAQRGASEGNTKSGTIKVMIESEVQEAQASQEAQSQT